ncbi:MAG TPA: MmcQ/YjbR family DNA-binding protein [Catalimonadaceae bacterium]|nr:MmcQ/YjbR family DNA-binding protein [Catalimonadaceae bacterium]HPI12324.1 MmcQ/YjbR family DNA-binding protein [Catalimonadaceae bacterium]
MNQKDQVRQWCLEMEGVVEEPHFEKTSFRIKKKIFATVDPAGEKVCVKLSAEEQSLFGVFDPTIVYPVPNKWGLQGWTLADLHRIPAETLHDLLIAAYREVSKQKGR